MNEFRIKPQTLERFMAEDPNNTISKHVQAIAGRVRDRAKEKAPVAKPDEDAKPGELRDSIHVKADPDNFGSYLVGSDVPYAPDIEFGTIRQAAQPFLRPAMDEIKTEGRA